MAGKNLIRLTLALVLAVILGYGLFMLSNLSDSRPQSVIVVLKNKQITAQFWRVVTAGIHAAAEEYKLNVTLTGGSGESDVDGQIQAIEEAIRQKPDAIVLAAADYDRLVAVGEKIKKSGIALILIDSGIRSNVADSLITTNNAAAGTRAGQLLHHLLEPESSVAVISYVRGSQSAIDRESGVISGLQALNRERRTETFYCDDDQEKARQTVADLLRTHRDIGGIVGLNEVSSLGAAQAIDELGLNGKVKLVGFDNSYEEVAFLQKGTIQHMIVQMPFKIGYLGIQAASDVLNGKKIPPFIDTGSAAISKDNIDKDENQQILFPFLQE
ncbi:hypothetical protein BC351_18710 [Paenibacillus ferrarius]|uniref:Periplasmic binding protein domain-containing protein n=1 Tax=Paenibacillus ferrarius TaxID=1469647 RepID=A0A1V4HQG4_9BACL|nr:substrate-binding domain-containing protein [Paenibacillus ferrarius]OPH59955.1 hypothetical protein BC351_18710 [Paenibacillus ferrarius]